jgi:hypothetical protein
MDILVIVLRLFHVVLGMLWVGSAFITAFFIAPAIQDSGPAGGTVMLAVQKRGLMIAMPLMAIGTLISGFWLFAKNWSGAMASPVAMTFGTGGAIALLTFIIGISFVMPAMNRAAKLMQTVGSLPEAERGARMAEIQKLRMRGGTLTKVVSYMLLAVAVAMAIARYV